MHSIAELPAGNLCVCNIREVEREDAGHHQYACPVVIVHLAADNQLAHILIDNTSTGSSLRANNLKIVDTLMESSTRMYASKAAMAAPEKKQKILELKMLFEAVLNARGRVMLEMNVAKDKFDALVKGLPSMRSPTVSPLFGDSGYAVKIAVKKSEVPTLLPKLQALGATDILEYALRKVL